MIMHCTSLAARLVNINRYALRRHQGRHDILSCILFRCCIKDTLSGGRKKGEQLARSLRHCFSNRSAFLFPSHVVSRNTHTVALNISRSILLRVYYVKHDLCVDRYIEVE